MRYLRLYMIGAFLVVLSVMWAWSKIDLAFNYVAVTGTVTQFAPSCHLEKSGAAPLEMSCNKAMAAVQTAQFHEYAIEGGSSVVYSYVSPADHATHFGKTWLSESSAVNTGAIAIETPEVSPGLPIAIYASRSQASVSKYLPR